MFVYLALIQGKNYTLSKRMSSHRTERDGILTFANNAKLHYTTDGPDKLTEIKAPKWTASEEEELLSKTPYWWLLDETGKCSNGQQQTQQQR